MIKYDRLTEEIELQWYTDEEEREKAPIEGFCAYFELTNGMRKLLYWSKKKINAHEEKFRKGKFQSKGWRENWENMAAKTVLRALLGKWGLLSINYQTADDQTLKIAADLATGQIDDTQNIIDTQAEQIPDNIDPQTGEVLNSRTAQEQKDDEVLMNSLDV